MMVHLNNLDDSPEMTHCDKINFLSPIIQFLWRDY